MFRPDIGSVALLVYRECKCGAWCATGEGEVAPICACGGRYLPGGGPPGMYGRTDGADHHEVRQLRRLGFTALFGYETAMSRLVGRLSQWMGLQASLGGGAWSLGHFQGDGHGRYFSADEVTFREDAPKQAVK